MSSKPPTPRTSRSQPARSKLLNSRLEALFEGMDQDELADSSPVQPVEAPASVASLQAPQPVETCPFHLAYGWHWNAGPDLCYTWVCPDVVDQLGIAPEALLGKPAAEYGLEPGSAVVLHDALESGLLPVDLILNYQNGEGQQVTCRVRIDSDPNQPGFVGSVEKVRGDSSIKEPQRQATRKPKAARKTEPAPQPFNITGTGTGYRAGQDQLENANELLTLAGVESLRQGKTVAMRAAFGQPAALAVPLLVQDGASQLLLEFSDDSPGRVWTEDERLLVQQVADQLTIALENARLFNETEQRNEELATLNTVIEAASRSLDVHTMLQAALIQVISTTGFDCGLVSMVDLLDGRLRIAAEKGLPENLINKFKTKGLENTLCELVYTSQQSLAITDMRQGAPLDVSGLVSQGLVSYQGAPLENKGKILGTICLFGREPHRLSDANIALLQAVGQQVGVAVENASLFKQTQSALGETAALYQASAELNSAASYPEILDVLRRYTVMGHESASQAGIFLFDQPWTDSTKPEWILPLALTTSEAGVSSSSADRYLLSEWTGSIDMLLPDGPTLISDIEIDPRLGQMIAGSKPGWREHLEKRGVKSLAYTPLSVAGKWSGLMIGMFSQAVLFTEEHGRRLMTLAGQAAVAIENLRLLDETRRKANQLQTAAEIARDTSGTLALDQLLGRAAEQIRERFNYYHVSVFLLSENGKEAVITAATGEAGTEMKRRSHHLAVGSRSIIGYVTYKGEPRVVNDVLTDPVHRLNPLLPLTRAEAGLPLKLGAGETTRIIGALDIQAANANAFTPEEIIVLQVLADQIAVAVDNARAYELSQRAVEEMRTADRLKSQFLANMSHELRTPLNSIIGFSRVILKGIDGPISEPQQQDLTAIYNSGQHLLKLINDILDLSKIEAGKMELALEDSVNLADLVNSVMSTMVGLVKDKPIKLVKNIAPDLPTVRADPVKVRQVMLNLLSNAAKFTDQGTITVEASLRSGPVGESAPSGLPEIVISVTDTGSGISPEDQSKLFLPFSQVDASPTRKTGGTGLGLSICRHLVEMHGGSIGLTSQVGMGSTFYFTLPVVRGRKGAAASLLGVQSRLNKLVFSVDDDRASLDLYERYFNNLGYHFYGLSDILQVQVMCRQINPLAIIVDALLPIADCWSILRSLKQQPETHNMPIQFVAVQAVRPPTESLGEQKVFKGIHLGSADFLLKPLEEENLLDTLERCNSEGRVREVLVVGAGMEDMRLIQKAFTEHTEYHLSTAADMGETLVYLRNQRPHLILLDLFNPSLDGFRLLDTLRVDPSARNVPIIFVVPPELDDLSQVRYRDYLQELSGRPGLNENELFEIMDQIIKRTT